MDLVSLLPFCGQCALWNHERCGHAVYLRIQSKEETVGDEGQDSGAGCPPEGNPGAPEEGTEGSERPLKKQSMSPAVPATSSGWLPLPSLIFSAASM